MSTPVKRFLNAARLTGSTIQRRAHEKRRTGSADPVRRKRSLLKSPGPGYFLSAASIVLTFASSALTLLLRLEKLYHCSLATGKLTCDP